MAIILKIISYDNETVPEMTGVQILASEDVTLGRSSGCSLCLEDSKCSKQHMSARLAGNKVIIKDLGSRNGTYINGMKIKDSYLFLGDTIKLGNTYLTLDESSMTNAEKTLLVRPESFAGSGSHDVKAFQEFPYPQTEQERLQSQQVNRVRTADIKLDKMGLAKQQLTKKLSDKDRITVEKAKSRKSY